MNYIKSKDNEYSKCITPLLFYNNYNYLCDIWKTLCWFTIVHLFPTLYASTQYRWLEIGYSDSMRVFTSQNLANAATQGIPLLHREPVVKQVAAYCCIR